MGEKKKETAFVNMSFSKQPLNLQHGSGSVRTVLCSSPSLIWNVCSKMEYMILPMPKDGSMTLGTTSSTVDGRTDKKCKI